MNPESSVDLIRSLIEQNRDGAMVVDDQGRIVTHNASLVELFEQPPGTRFASTLRLGPVNLQRLLVRAAMAAGEQDLVGRPRLETLDFRAELDFRQPPIPVRVTSLILPLPKGARRLRLVTIRAECAPAEIPADAAGFDPGSPLESADPRCQMRLGLARQATHAGCRLLLLGETGTGKTLLAQTLHASGPRGSGPFVEIHCAALPETALESEILGHARGAFPGATTERTGRLEAASGGTLLLDQVEAMPPHLQGILQRALGEDRFERLGENQPRQFDAHIIATSSRDLRQRVEAGEFPADLYFRLAGLSVLLPPLRERTADLDRVVERWSEHNRITISESGRRCLRDHPWPGNFRELRSLLEVLRLQTDAGGSLDGAAVAQALASPGAGTELAPNFQPDHLPESSPPPFSAEEERERDELRAALAAHDGNRSQAARSLGMDRTTLWRKLHRLRLSTERSTR